MEPCKICAPWVLVFGQDVRVSCGCHAVSCCCDSSPGCVRSILPARRAGSIALSDDGFVALLNDTGVSMLDVMDVLYSCPASATRGYLSHGSVGALWCCCRRVVPGLCNAVWVFDIQ